MSPAGQRAATPPRRRSATWALVAVNAALFALETLWGGSESEPTLYRMGAHLGRAGLASEPWRLVSSAFLHIGPLHLLLNMWALVAFGRLVEEVLGPRRFLVLYAACAAAGGIASALAHPQTLAAGASGAVWGLMVGEIALVWRLRRTFGAEAVKVNTALMAQPLIFNLIYSFRPGIDMAAHLGGGLAGGALIASGLFGPRPESRAWRPLAGAAALVMAAGVGLALHRGRPWELRWPPPLEPRPVAGTPVMLPLPASLAPRPSPAEGGQLFGNLLSDPVAVSCRAEPLGEPVTAEQRAAYLARLAAELAARPTPRAASRQEAPRVVRLPRGPAVYQARRSPDAAPVHTWVLIEAGWLVRLDVALRDDAAGGWRDVPAAIARGTWVGAVEP